MAPQPQYIEPDEVYIGDSWAWTIHEPDYPATDGWTLSYSFRGVQKIDFDAVVDADGVSYDVLVTPAQQVTAALVAGTYEYIGYYHASTGQYAGLSNTIRQGFMRFLPNLRTDPVVARQQHCERMVANIEAELELRLSGDGTAHTNYAIEGRSIAKISLDGPGGLYALRSKYTTELIMLSRGGQLPSLGVVIRRPKQSVGDPWGGFFAP